VALLHSLQGGELSPGTGGIGKEHRGGDGECD
jgi:hypothetical protein